MVPAVWQQSPVFLDVPNSNSAIVGASTGPAPTMAEQQFVEVTRSLRKLNYLNSSGANSER